MVGKGRKTFKDGKRRDRDAETEASDARNERIARRLARKEGARVEREGPTFRIISREKSPRQEKAG